MFTSKPKKTKMIHTYTKLKFPKRSKPSTFIQTNTCPTISKGYKDKS